MAAGRPHKASADDVIAAIPGTGGVKMAIARRLGVDRHSVDAYIRRWPSVARAYKDECESTCDIAEGLLLQAIEGGDTSTAKWWLAKKRRREYGESIDISIKPLEKMSDDELLAIIEQRPAELGE